MRVSIDLGLTLGVAACGSDGTDGVGAGKGDRVDDAFVGPACDS